MVRVYNSRETDRSVGRVTQVAKNTHMFLLLFFGFVQEASFMWLLFQLKDLQQITGHRSLIVGGFGTAAAAAAGAAAATAATTTTPAALVK